MFWVKIHLNFAQHGVWGPVSWQDVEDQRQLPPGGEMGVGPATADQPNDLVRVAADFYQKHAFLGGLFTKNTHF